MKNENQNTNKGLELFHAGKPNYNELTKTEKRLLLFPLVDVIRDFYKDPNNRAKYEQWRKENP